MPARKTARQLRMIVDRSWGRLDEAAAGRIFDLYRAAFGR